MYIMTAIYVYLEIWNDYSYATALNCISYHSLSRSAQWKQTLDLWLYVKCATQAE